MQNAALMYRIIDNALSCVSVMAMGVLIAYADAQAHCDLSEERTG